MRIFTFVLLYFCRIHTILTPVFDDQKVLNALLIEDICYGIAYIKTQQGELIG